MPNIHPESNMRIIQIIFHDIVSISSYYRVPPKPPYQGFSLPKCLENKKFTPIFLAATHPLTFCFRELNPPRLQLKPITFRLKVQHSYQLGYAGSSLQPL